MDTYLIIIKQAFSTTKKTPRSSKWRIFIILHVRRLEHLIIIFHWNKINVEMTYNLSSDLLKLQ